MYISSNNFSSRAKRWEISSFYMYLTKILDVNQFNLLEPGWTREKAEPKLNKNWNQGIRFDSWLFISY